MRVFSAAVKLFFSVALGCLFAAAILYFIPFYNQNALFLFTLPVGFLFCCLIYLNPQASVVLILLFRSLMDPVFNLTRAGAHGVGIGALLNLLVILLFFRLLFLNPGTLHRQPYHKWWIGFLFMAMASLLYTPVLTQGIRFSVNLATYGCMLFLPSLLIKQREEKLFWVKVLIFATLLPAAVSLLDLAWLFGPGRIQGSFSHPNILAFYLTFSIAVVLLGLQSGYIGRQGFARLFWYAFFAVLFILLLFTKTRNAWIACWFFITLYALLQQRRLLIFSLLAPALALVVPGVRERVFEVQQQHLSSDPEALNSFAWRLSLWQEAWPWILKKPIFGYGLASFKPLSEKLFQSIRGFGAHNVYVEMLFETGLLGLSLFLGMFASLLKALGRAYQSGTEVQRKETVLILCYLLSFLIVCLADNMMYYLAFNWYFFFLIGIYLRDQEFENAADAEQ